MNILTKISEREKKFLIIGAVSILLILIYYAYGQYADFREQVSDFSGSRTRLLETQLTKIAKKEVLQKQVDDIRKKLGTHENLFLKGSKAPVAAAELQKTIKDISSGLNIDIRLERALNPVDALYYTGIPVEVGFTSSTFALKELLAQLRTTPFLLNVTEMKIRVLNISKPEDINVTLVVSGFIKKPVAADTENQEAQNAT
jgi:Tfp pilus assembly protein PilN